MFVVSSLVLLNAVMMEGDALSPCRALGSRLSKS